MGKKSFYAVAAGHHTGIFEDFDEVKAATRGFSGARHMGFKSRTEALAWLADNGVLHGSTPTVASARCATPCPCRPITPCHYHPTSARTRPVRWPECSDHTGGWRRGSRPQAFLPTRVGSPGVPSLTGRLVAGPPAASVIGTSHSWLPAGGVAALRTGRAREGSLDGVQLASTSIRARLASVAARAASAHASGAAMICNAQSAYRW